MHEKVVQLAQPSEKREFLDNPEGRKVHNKVKKLMNKLSKYLIFYSFFRINEERFTGQRL